MGSIQNKYQEINGNNEQDLSLVFQFGYAPVVHAAIATSIELNLFGIIAKSGPDAQLSSFEISSQLPTKNQEAPLILDRMLQLLASYTILNCTLDSDKDGNITRLYGLTSLSKCLVPDEGGISMAPAVLWIKAIRDSCYCLKDAILDGGISFNKAHDGMHLFEFMGKNNGLNEVFNQAMRCKTTILMREVLEEYKGFEGLKVVVDVGGGLGAVLDAVVSKYPGIKGINFDLPHVIKNAPQYPDVEHVQGDMFQSVPRGDAIILKHILHDWTDEDYLKLLKICLKALPDSGGKVIVIEMIIPEFPEANVSTRNALTLDLLMLTLTPGGKERTQKQFETLAIGAGFEASKLVCRAHQHGILEFYKN